MHTRKMTDLCNSVPAVVEGYRAQLDPSVDEFKGDESTAVALEHAALDTDLV